MDRDTAIEIKDVSKSYKSVKALRDISFNIRKGELFLTERGRPPCSGS